MSESEDTEHAKREMRRLLRTRRAEASPDYAKSQSAALTGQLTRLVSESGAQTMTAYLSLPDEPDTRGMLDWCREAGIRVLLPVIRADGLLDWAEFDGTETTEATLGVPEPTTEVLAPTVLDDVDLMIVPATAAGRDGSRLGGGRGFFDKTIACMAERPPVYAVVHDDELFDSVPNCSYDQPVTGVVTQTQTIRVTG